MYDDWTYIYIPKKAFISKQKMGGGEYTIYNSNKK